MTETEQESMPGHPEKLEPEQGDIQTDDPEE